MGTVDLCTRRLTKSLSPMPLSAPRFFFAIFAVFAFASSAVAESGKAGFVLVNLLPVEEEMDLTVNGTTLGKMRAGRATGPIPFNIGENRLSLSWGEDKSVEGSVVAKPGATSIAVAYLAPAAAREESQTGGAPKFKIAELPSGTRVSQPQFVVFSSLTNTVTLAVNAKQEVFEPFSPKKVEGDSGKIRLSQGSSVLFDLDANPPAIMDGPMRWYLFLVSAAGKSEPSVLAVPDFQHGW